MWCIETASLEEESSDESAVAEGGAAPAKHRHGAEPCQAGLVIEGSSCKGTPGDQCKLYKGALQTSEETMETSASCTRVHCRPRRKPWRPVQAVYDSAPLGPSAKVLEQAVGQATVRGVRTREGSCLVC